MPRTKVVRNVRNTENVKPDKRKLNEKLAKDYMVTMQSKNYDFDKAIEEAASTISFKVKTGLNEILVKMSFNGTKTVHELKLDAEKPPSDTISSKSILGNLTKSTIKNNTLASIRKGNTSRAPRRSRSQASSVQRPRQNRLSKSLPRKPTNPKSSHEVNTPANKIIPNNFGMITPKIKPNTAQVMLRRPKHGEIALSMQGSPLMVSSIISDHVANVNIPLQDGRIISIQPNHGLRPSEVPEFDDETLRQIQTLKDNLNQVYAFSTNR